MGISFWHKKKEEPQAPKAVPENGVNAVKRSDTESDAPGGVRLRRIAVGAAVILSAIVIAGPFVVSERAVKAESPAKTEIPSPPRGFPGGTGAAGVRSGRDRGNASAHFFSRCRVAGRFSHRPRCSWALPSRWLRPRRALSRLLPPRFPSLRLRLILPRRNSPRITPPKPG